MAYNNNSKDDYKVDQIFIEIDTDDKGEQEREYIEHIVNTVMGIANEYIARHPNINVCTSQGLTELLKDIKRKYKAEIDII